MKIQDRKVGISWSLCVDFFQVKDAMSCLSCHTYILVAYILYTECTCLEKTRHSIRSLFSKVTGTSMKVLKTIGTENLSSQKHHRV